MINPAISLLQPLRTDPVSAAAVAGNVEASAGFAALMAHSTPIDRPAASAEPASAPVLPGEQEAPSQLLAAQGLPEADAIAAVGAASELVPVGLAALQVALAPQPDPVHGGKVLPQPGADGALPDGNRLPVTNARDADVLANTAASTGAGPLHHPLALHASGEPRPNVLATTTIDAPEALPIASSATNTKLGDAIAFGQRQAAAESVRSARSDPGLTASAAPGPVRASLAEPNTAAGAVDSRHLAVPGSSSAVDGVSVVSRDPAVISESSRGAAELRSAELAAASARNVTPQQSVLELAAASQKSAIEFQTAANPVAAPPGTLQGARGVLDRTSNLLFDLNRMADPASALRPAAEPEPVETLLLRPLRPESSPLLERYAPDILQNVTERASTSTPTAVIANAGSPTAHLGHSTGAFTGAVLDSNALASSQVAPQANIGLTNVIGEVQQSGTTERAASPAAALPSTLQLTLGNPQELGDRLGTLLGSVRALSGTALSIALAPQELGRLEIRISSGADQSLNVSITAQHAGTRDLVEAQISRLKTALDGQGFDKVQVDLRDERDNRSGANHAGYDRQPGSQDQNASDSNDPSSHQTSRGMPESSLAANNPSSGPLQQRLALAYGSMLRGIDAYA